MSRDLSGVTFGFLTVVREHGRLYRDRTWFCRCSCGQEIVVRQGKLLAGAKKACNINGHRARVYECKDGGIRQRAPVEYRAWSKMLSRCRNPNEPRYPHYGGRGIKVCLRWATDFAAFYRDMGPKPRAHYTLERIDVDGDYEPSNCRWATKREQTRNKQTSRYIDLGGRRRLLVDVAASVGLHPSVLSGRLRAGWPLADAVTRPVRAKRKNGSKNLPEISGHPGED